MTSQLPALGVMAFRVAGETLPDAELVAVLDRYLRILQSHPAARAAYAAVKRRVGEQFAGDRQAYTAGKAAFVAGLLSVDQLPCAQHQAA